MLLELKRLPQKDGDVAGFTDQLRQVLTVEADIKRPQWNTTLVILYMESVSVEKIAQATSATGQIITQKIRAGD